MSEPTVCAVMLTRDRPEMAKRAVQAFREQTYEWKDLLIWDTGSSPLTLVTVPGDVRPEHYWAVATRSIGELRNHAAQARLHQRMVDVDGYVALHSNRYGIVPDIICHWDDDDWSHPNRIAEQVALLQSSGADAVGYKDMLWWRTCAKDPKTGIGFRKEEAWLYLIPAGAQTLGASLCYWRKTWERKPFKDTNVGEDLHWQAGLIVERATIFTGSRGLIWNATPRMICSIHGGNTSSWIGGPPEWHRAPDWDQYCRRVMTL